MPTPANESREERERREAHEAHARALSLEVSNAVSGVLARHGVNMLLALSRIDQEAILRRTIAVYVRALAPNESGHPWTLWVTDDDSELAGEPTSDQEAEPDVPRPTEGDEAAIAVAAALWVEGPAPSVATSIHPDTTNVGPGRRRTGSRSPPMSSTRRKLQPHSCPLFLLPARVLSGTACSLCCLYPGEIGLTQHHLRDCPDSGASLGFGRTSCASQTGPLWCNRPLGSDARLDDKDRAKLESLTLFGLHNTHCPSFQSSSRLARYQTTTLPSTGPVTLFYLLCSAAVILIVSC